MGAWAAKLTFAGDTLLLAKSQEEVRRMHCVLIACCDQWGLFLRDDKLCLWKNAPGEVVRFGGRAVTPRAAMPLLGCILSGDRLRTVRHRSAMVWNQSWLIRRFLTTRFLGL